MAYLHIHILLVVHAVKLVIHKKKFIWRTVGWNPDVSKVGSTKYIRVIMLILANLNLTIKPC